MEKLALFELLLSQRGVDGRIPLPVYNKFTGTHWILAQLAELDYLPGDKFLEPMRDQELEWLLGEKHVKYVKMINNRWRRCGSQEGYALFSLLKLGLADSRCEDLAGNLIKWQWPDGGWNCDKHPNASHSSFHESWLPMRALYAYGKASGDTKALAAAERTAEHFLKRQLYLRLSTGQPAGDVFLRMTYPWYWHYSALTGLLVVAEMGRISDPRCQLALDWLESRRLPDGGWPADHKWWTVTERSISGKSLIHWGTVSPSRSNPWITQTAQKIFIAAGRN
ncbi:MAG TPA: hypothetical protein VN376_04595 [Longilinea sp.]|nr:hypothetical protein [Longilinea sp.]